MMRPPPKRVAGFTLFEALTTLGITSLALGAMLMVGMRGAATGMRLGARAISHADEQVSLQALRDTLSAMILPALSVQTTVMEAEYQANEAIGQGDTFEGEATKLAADVVATRDTPCMPFSGYGRLTLEIKSENSQTLLTCTLNEEEPVILAKLNWPDAVFSYSETGETWTDTWTVQRGETVEAQETPDAEQRKVYVRIASTSTPDQVIALVTSGRQIPLTFLGGR